MSGHYQPYALESGNRGKSMGAVERYAVREGGCGGRIVAREWGLSRDQAAELCRLLESAFERGLEEGVEA